MLALRKPDSRQIARFLERQARFEVTYDEVGATAGRLPPNYSHDEATAELGDGEEVFRRARAALRGWQHFQVGWVEAVPDDTPLAPGEVVAIRARLAGLWFLSACRIVEVVDDAGPPRRFGFAYGTLPDHPEQGEEQFLVEQQPDGRVCYRVTAFYRPNRRLVRLGWPLLRRLFDRFRRQSAQAMQRAV